MTKFLVSSSPHITGPRTTAGIMLEVCIALVPAVIAAVYFYGIYVLFLITLSIGSAVGFEALFNVIVNKKQTVKDCSAMVTGLLLALNLPVSVPFYVPIIGSAFAVMVVKMLFGGIGKNFANPAITGRIFLVLAWSGIMTRFVSPIDWSLGAGEMFKYFGCILKGLDGMPMADGVATCTTATPLASLTEGVTAVKALPVADMFFGGIGGCMGEVSALALLIGGIYLIVRRIIDWRVPVVFVGTVAVSSWIFGGSLYYILPSVLGGGLLIGAFFMATDYSTSPNTKTGLIIFAFGCGFLTSLIRFFGSYPEGVSFAVLLMNILTPLIDKWVKPHIFGYRKPQKVKKEAAQ